MSYFGNKIILKEIVPVLDATEEEIPLLGGDVQRKRQRGGGEAPVWSNR